MLRITGEVTSERPQLVIEEVSDPATMERSQLQDCRFRRNSEWLQGQWAELFPKARGKFVAVAGQQVFVAETPQEAWAQALAVHPEDDGAFCHYVFPTDGPRIYANQRRMA